MMNTIEISHQAIRLIQCSKDGIEDIDVYPIKEGVDPISALGSAALPSPLGAVRVIIHHEDMLIGSMHQAPCPEERLQRLIEFEMESTLGDNIESSLMSWYVSPTGGAGDMRILTMITRKTLIAAIEEALKVHKGRLCHLIHPAIGLFLSWRQLNTSNDAILVDCGGKNTHIAIVENGELVFIRSCTFGMDELAQDISELRNIELDAAKEIVAKLSKGTPDDIKQIIFRHASVLANNVTNVIRFAQAQLNIKEIKADYIAFSGAGARVPFIIEPTGKHLNMQTRILNPFTGLVANLPPSQMDILAELPSPWGPAFGCCAATDMLLDGKQQIQRENKEFRETSGVLRIAATLTIVLVLWSFVNQKIVSGANNISQNKLSQGDKGLIPDAQEKHAQLQIVKKDHTIALTQAQFLNREHRPGRISREILACIANIQNAESCPISLQSLTVSRSRNGMLSVELHGRAQSVGSLSTADAINNFENALKQRLPFLNDSMAHIPPDAHNTPSGYHPFAYRFSFTDSMVSTTDNNILSVH